MHGRFLGHPDVEGDYIYIIVYPRRWSYVAETLSLLINEILDAIFGICL
jgi:hypothetical protein